VFLAILADVLVPAAASELPGLILVSHGQSTRGRQAASVKGCERDIPLREASLTFHKG
jgi:hypothetical protein